MPSLTRSYGVHSILLGHHQSVSVVITGHPMPWIGSGQNPPAIPGSGSRFATGTILVCHEQWIVSPRAALGTVTLTTPLAWHGRGRCLDDITGASESGSYPISASPTGQVPLGSLP